MKPRKVISVVLFGLAALTLIGLMAAFFGGNPKGFGAFVFAGFFLMMAGWIIGDY